MGFNLALYTSPPAALPGGTDFKNLDKWVWGWTNGLPYPYPFVKLFKSLAPGRATGGFELFYLNFCVASNDFSEREALM
jgi:hypothetical protein